MHGQDIATQLKHTTSIETVYRHIYMYTFILLTHQKLIYITHALLHTSITSRTIDRQIDRQTDRHTYQTQSAVVQT